MNKENQHKLEEHKLEELRKKILDERRFEKDEILQRSKEIKGRQLTIDGQGDLHEVNELNKLLERPNGKSPKEVYDLYYPGIYNVLNRTLPPKKGEGALLRRLVFDELGVFLADGKVKKNGRRGADGRMTYSENMEEVVEIISSWISESGDAISLFFELFDLNEKHAYPHPTYDDTSVAFEKIMRNRKKP